MNPRIQITKPLDEAKDVKPKFLTKGVVHPTDAEVKLTLTVNNATLSDIIKALDGEWSYQIESGKKGQATLDALIVGTKTSDTISFRII